MRQAVILCGATSFLMAFLGGLFAFSLVTPSRATAQPSQAPEVRASAFSLVGEDGTVIARLQPGPGQGGPPAGVLILYSGEGTRRISITGAGTFNVFDEDGGATVFRAGRSFIVAPFGDPPVNGVVLGPGGSISTRPEP